MIWFGPYSVLYSWTASSTISKIPATSGMAIASSTVLLTTDGTVYSGTAGWAKLSMMPLKSLVPPNQPTAATTRIRISVFHQLLRGRS